MEEFFVTAAQTGTDAAALGRFAPILRSRHRAGISPEANRKDIAPNRSRTSYPTFSSPRSLIDVARASPRCELCAQTMTFALPASRCAEFVERLDHVRVAQIPRLVVAVIHGAIIALGVRHESCVLLRREVFLLGDVAVRSIRSACLRRSSTIWSMTSSSQGSFPRYAVAASVA